MVWRIHSYSTKDGTGSVVAPHSGPWPFGPDQNLTECPDYTAGEVVVVESEWKGDDCTIVSVKRVFPAQPKETECTIFRNLNESHYGDSYIIENSDDDLQLWVGDCCSYCGPSAVVRFSKGHFVQQETSDCEFDSPLFRYATASEIEEQIDEVPPNFQAYYVVTSHGNGEDGPGFLLIAEGVSIEFHGITRN